MLDDNATRAGTTIVVCLYVLRLGGRDMASCNRHGGAGCRCGSWLKLGCAQALVIALSALHT